jgi:uncharacterized membrane protein HdeD (DUF308 family)
MNESSHPTPTTAEPARPPRVAVALLVEHELRHLQKDWWWFVALGILLILSGLVALVYPTLSSIAAVVVLGMTLLVSGVATIVASFWAGKWSALILQLLVGILYVVTGFILMDTPIASTVNLTLFVAALFIVVGIMRSVAALVLRFPQWGWALLSGLLTTLVGTAIYKNLPETALWAIGTLVGIELIFDGWFWVMLGMALWKLPVSRE